MNRAQKSSKASLNRAVAKPSSFSSGDDSAASVLIVEDADDVRRYLANMLAPLGVNLSLAGNGKDALSLIDTGKIDVIISDLVMPEMSGVMLMHTLLERGISIPFILLTGWADKDSAVQSLRLGVFDYLEKPVEGDELRAVVSEAIKVGRQHKVLMQQLSHDTKTEVTELDSRAYMQILKLKMLHPERGEQSDKLPMPPVDLGDNQARWRWPSLCTAFVEESLAQLVFARAALGSVIDGKDIEQNWNYLVRVVQSIRQAADAIRLHHVVELALAFEGAMIMCRKQKGCLAGTATTFNDAISSLQRTLTHLEDAETRKVQARLQQILHGGATDSMS